MCRVGDCQKPRGNLDMKRIMYAGSSVVSREIDALLVASSRNASVSHFLEIAHFSLETFPNVFFSNFALLRVFTLFHASGALRNSIFFK